LRIVAANLFCLNPQPTRAVAAVAAQGADVVAMIESTRRFGARAGTRLPPWRFTAKTRKRGLPVSLYARESLQVASVQQHGLGWIEWDVGGVHLLVVHAIAPYLPWRWSVRERQLLALAHRLNAIHARDPDRPAIALGDFNTADFEPVWRRMEGRIDHWRRLDIDGPLEPTRRRRRRHGTWPFGGVWAPICVDHVMAAPTI